MPSSTRHGKEEASLNRMASRQSKSNPAIKEDIFVRRPADILIRDGGAAVGEEKSLQARMSFAKAPLAEQRFKLNLMCLTCTVFYESCLCSWLSSGHDTVYPCQRTWKSKKKMNGFKIKIIFSHLDLFLSSIFVRRPLCPMTWSESHRLICVLVFGKSSCKNLFHL